MPGRIAAPGRYTPQFPTRGTYPRPAAARPSRGITVGQPGQTGEITSREAAAEESRKFNEQFDEDRRRFEAGQAEKAQAYRDSRDRANRDQATWNISNNPGMPSGGSPSLSGINALAPPMQTSATPAPEPGTYETWNHERDIDERNRKWSMEDFDKLRGMFDSTLSAPGPTSDKGGMIDPNEAAARAAAFARAKETAGRNARAGLDTLYDVMASSGRAGSGAEAMGAAGVVGGAQGDINDFTREQEIQDLNRSREISDRNYAGDLTRRGQNMNWLQSLLGILSSRGRGIY